MFITLEGPEGSGKTSQAARLVDFLRAEGYELTATREPGGTPIGDQIRVLLSELKYAEMHPRTEVLLFQASRAQHVEQVIRPCLERGGLVICDRYADSSMAYQGYGYELDLDQVRSLIEFATGGLKPDMTLLLDVDVEVGLKRRMNSGEWNRLDASSLAFHRRVRQGYLELARLEPQRWVKIDAGRPPDAVQAAIREQVLKRFALEGIQPLS